MHPNPPNLSELSDSQIDQKMVQLNSIYFITGDEYVRHQIILLLDCYKMELEERRAAAKKLQEQNSDGDDHNDLDSLIKIR